MGFGIMKIPRGKYKGQTLWQVLKIDPLYIDNMQDWIWENPHLKRAFKKFIEDPKVQRILDEAVFGK